jgi:hypothetical protein
MLKYLGEAGVSIVVFDASDAVKATEVYELSPS